MTVGISKTTYVKIAYLLVIVVMAVVAFGSAQQLWASPAAPPVCPIISCTSNAVCSAAGGQFCICNLALLTPRCHVLRIPPPTK